MSPFSRSSHTPASRAASLKPESVKGPDPEVTDDEASVLHTLDTESPASALQGHRAESSSEAPSLPLQKRRRVTRACDECLMVTIALSRSPSDHLVDIILPECTYDKPSNRRRNPAPQYIEALENKLSRAEALLRKFMPDVDLNDPNLDPLVQQEFRMREQARLKTVTAKGKQSSSSSSVDAQLQSMIENVGQLDLDEKGDYDFHGNSSGSVFFKRMKEHFRSLLGRDYQIPFLPRPPRPAGMLHLDSSRPSSSSRTQSNGVPEVYNLPPKDRALALCAESLNNATCLLRIVHLPSFYQMLDSLYEKPVNGKGKEDKRKLALAFSVMALGSMYDVPEGKGLETPPYKISMEEALKYYNTAKVLLQDVTECRDLTSLQALLFMVLFIQSISNLSTCYGFVGIALRSALRMGLHRRLPHIQLNAVETETRRRVFYICRQMDTYVSALLGFPLLLNDDDIDQPLPTEVDDQYITKDEILVPPPGTPSFFEAFNAHVKLMDILRKVVKHVYPLKGIEQSEVEGVGEPYASYTISYNKVKEMEKELQQWNEELPIAWRPDSEGPVEVVRVRNLLRFTYAHVQMMLYRPFLHYVSPRISAGKEVNERAYACGVAGISVARNIVHIGTEMRKQVPLVGPYWFTLFSEFSAIISLVFFVLENQDKPGTMEILADAVACRDMISGLAGKSMVADRISSALDMLFDQLPDNLKDIKARTSRKRPASDTGSGRLSMPPPPTYTTESTHHQAERSNQPRGISSKKAGKAPVGSVQQDISVDTSPLPQPDFGGSFPSFQFSPLDMSIPSPDSMAAAGLHEPNHLDLQHQVTSAGNPIHQLDAMMFPSDDPLAYPNQPRDDLGVQQPGVNSANPGGIPHHDPSHFYIPTLYDGLEGQLMGPLPPYLLQSQAQPGFGFPPQMYSDPMLQMHHQMGHRPQPQPAQSRLMRRRAQQQRDMHTASVRLQAPCITGFHSHYRWIVITVLINQQLNKQPENMNMEATNVDHSLIVVDEFDALSIELSKPEPAKPEVRKRYPAKLHVRKCVKELEAKDGIIYLPGQLESTWEDSDLGLPFRQRRYFYYLSGINYPGCAVTYDIAADKLTLWIPYAPPATILYFGNSPTPEDCLAISDVHDVKYIGELPAYLSSRLSVIRTLYVLRPSQLPKFEGFDQIKRTIKIDTTSLLPVLDEVRVIKTDHEIAMIRKANEISSDAHKKVAQFLYSMKNECEIEATFLSSCTSRNAHTQAYPVIAGSGPNASTLHYGDNNESLAGRQVVVLDAGAEWNCYASDVTRTLLIGPASKVTKEARAIYKLVHQMQEECIERIKPGVVFRNLQLHATLVAVKGLLELGILHNGTADEIFKNGTGAAFFPHGLGHHVGLDVHDVLSRELLRPAGENIWGKRRPIGPQSVRAMIKQAASEVESGRASGGGSSRLRPNMVVTVEPGIYFCRPYIEAYFLRNEEHARYIDVAVLERYWDVGGVRVEDDIRVVDGGFENLTTAPKGEELLRILGLQMVG
ncbi:hypothetical protein F5B20DRAFT_578400 [Whalleya microplaca]|nr:hypothetical protein F5B20DRAFT_578400 [Whalleya microplaca]